MSSYFFIAIFINGDSQLDSFSNKTGIGTELDPYIMGYKDRIRYVNLKHKEKIFDRAGNAAPTILLNGNVIGVWQADEKSHPLFRFYLFEERNENIIKQINKKAAEIGEFITTQKVDIRECRSMIPLTKRTVGSFMSPLRNCV